MLNSREILQKAKNEGYALGAFNAGNLEIVKAVIEAAKNLNSALIVETSSGEAKHFGMKNFLAVTDGFRQGASLPILTNFDHGPGLEECQEAIRSGYNLVHFDGSQLPYEENVKITRALVDEAHKKGILIEGEIDRILGQSAPHPSEDAESVQASGNYTDPERAIDFVQRTGVDILAVFVGNLHGTYRQPLKLDLELLELLAGKLPCFLSLHGGSGVEGEDIKKAVKLGKVVKINVNTELRVAYRDTLENVLKGSEEVAVYKIMPPVMAAVQKVVEEKVGLFGKEEEKEEEIPKLTGKDASGTEPQSEPVTDLETEGDNEV